MGVNRPSFAESLTSGYVQPGWGATLPWIEYEGDARAVRDGTDIEMGFTFSSRVRIVFAKYSMEGTWLGLEDMTTQARLQRVPAGPM